MMGKNNISYKAQEGCERLFKFDKKKDEVEVKE